MTIDRTNLLNSVGTGSLSYEGRNGVKLIAEALDEMDAGNIEIVDGKFHPHAEQRVGCEIVYGTVNAAQDTGRNEPSEGGDPEAVYTKQSREPYAELVKRMQRGEGPVDGAPHHLQRLNERAK